jgi:hypothetical protein
MAIPDIEFVPMEDYHLLRGNNLDLLSMLVVEGQSATDYKSAHQTTTYTFTPLFLGTLTGTVFESIPLKLRVDTSTGLVEALAGVPVKVKSNFIVEVEAEDSADPGKKHTTIRIHIHNHVVQAWLTPSLLTLRPQSAFRPELTHTRFGIHAEFDDGVFGDVTTHPGITFGPGGNVNGRDLVIDTGNNPGDPPIEITATLPANLEGKQAKGHIQIDKPWSSAGTIRTDIVPGGGWPGTINPRSAPNILFLCDGYQAADEPTFVGQVNTFVELLKGSTITSPFNFLATSMNFWRAFVPSRQRGITYLCEMFIKELGSLSAEPVPDPVKPPAAGNWTLENLVYAAGLPIMTEGALSIADLKTLWGSLVGPLPFARIPDGIIGDWKDLGSRMLLEEQDTALSLAYGRRPTSATPSDTRETGFHHGRANRFDIDRMLPQLQDVRNGVDITDLWNFKAGHQPPDRTNIVFLLSFAKWDRGVNYGSYIGMNCEDRHRSPVNAVPNKAYELDPSATISPEFSGGRMIRGAHEIGHSFFLGDEYSGEGTMPAAENVDGTNVNLQKSGDLKPGADIDGAKIKWRWPRIKKAAVIVDVVDGASPGTFTFSLVPGQGNQFSKGETILLRKRKMLESLKKTTTVLATELEVDDPHAADSVTVKVKGAGAVTLADLKAFPGGSIVFVPVVAPASVLSAAYPYAELVAKNVMDHITARKRALNVDPADPLECTGDNSAIQMPIKIDIPLAIPAANLPQIVGLFTGGHHFNCGVYHPTGSCIMRNSDDDGKQFCPVCQYALVEMINPYKHWEIDIEYAKIYPLK